MCFDVFELSTVFFFISGRFKSKEKGIENNPFYLIRKITYRFFKTGVNVKNLDNMVLWHIAI